MELSEFTFRLILIFIPGLISFFIIEKFATLKEVRIHQLIIYSFLLGFISYLSYYSCLIIINAIKVVLHNICNTAATGTLKFSFQDVKFSFFKVLIDKEANLDLKEIGYAAFLSIIVGIIFTYLIKHKIFYRIGKKIRITNKHGDIDVWSFIMNYPEIPKLVIIKDKEKDCTYYGWIELFSQIKDIIEIFLKDVTIYRIKNGEKEEIFETPGLYLLKKSDNIEVQFPYMKKEDIKKEGSNERK